MCGTLAGPLFITVVVAQALTRTGFDLTRDAASLLDDGSWGWVQAANFIVTGLLLIAAAAGLRHTLRTGPGHKWIPRLLAIAGVLCAVGVFTAGAPHGSLTLFTGVSLALLWVAATTTRLVRQATP